MPRQIHHLFVTFLTEKRCSNGIYIILDDLTGKFYLGSVHGEESKFFIKRSSDHRNGLEDNEHHSVYLQNAWNKRGKEHFNMFIIENLDGFSRIEILDIEQWYLDNWKPAYNMSPTACGGGMSKEGKKRMVERLSKEWIVEFPDGKEVKIKNLKKFCKRHKLDNTEMMKVARGEKLTNKGWRCRHINSPKTNLEELRKMGRISQLGFKEKEYLLKFKNGKTEKIKGLAEWCRKNNLCSSIKQKEIDNKLINYIGSVKNIIEIENIESSGDIINWNEIRANYNEKDRQTEIDSGSHVVTYPDGVEVITYNLYHFAKYHNLQRSNLYACVRGIKGTHKGFKIRKNQ